MLKKYWNNHFITVNYYIQSWVVNNKLSYYRPFY